MPQLASVSSVVMCCVFLRQPPFVHLSSDQEGLLIPTEIYPINMFSYLLHGHWHRTTCPSCLPEPRRVYIPSVVGRLTFANYNSQEEPCFIIRMEVI